MIALKSTAAVMLAAMVLVITPTFIHQDAGAGTPDDVAQLLPEGTLGFIELVKAPRLLHDWKEYVGSLTSPEGKDKACRFIEEWFTKTMEIVPERILKDLKEGLPSIQRMALALTGAPDGELPWVFIATSSDPKFFRKLVEEDLAVFASEELSHHGVKVLSIRKLGELKSDQPVFVAAPGSRLLVTTRWSSLTDALDRAAGRGTGADLRTNAMYAKLAPAASDDPALRAFTRWDWDELMGSGMGFMSRRYSAIEMDKMDAAFGYRSLTGTIVEATFKPGQVVSTLRMPVRLPSRIFEAMRQPPGPKHLLAHLPKKTVFFAHTNLKGGKEVWSDITSLVRRYQEAERKAQPGNEAQDPLEFINQQSKKELGCTPAEIAALVGNEILVAVTDPGEAPGFERMFLVLFRTTDGARMRELMETVAKTSGKYTKTDEDKMTIYTRAEPGSPCFGIRDTVVGFACDDAMMKEALAQNEDPDGIARRLPKDDGTASGVMGVNPAGVIDLLLKVFGTEKPEELSNLRPDDWSFSVSRMDKDQAVLVTHDSGYGAVLQATLAAAPLTMLGFRLVMVAHQVGEPEPPAAHGDKPAPEPPALAAAEIEKRTASLVPQLRSDELTVREKASADLRALGRQALPQLVAAFKAEKDAEARSRLANILVEYKAWDLLPELLDRKVDAFYDEFLRAIDSRNEDDWWGGFAAWRTPDSPEVYCIEPTVQTGFLARFKNGDVLTLASGMRRLADRVRSSDLPPPKRAQFAALLAYHDCGGAHEAVLEMREAAADAESRAFLTAALGWSDDAKAKEALVRSLESKDLAVRRGAFIALEKTRDPEAVTRLLDRAKDGDFETRWNAGYTLGVITAKKIELNAFLPDSEYDAQLKAARAWWDGHKGSFKR